MKKIYTLLAAMATTLAMNAATVTATWLAADETDLANNADINDKTFTVDNMVSFVTAQGTATANCAFQKSSTTPACIRVQAHSTLTFSAEEGATITSIKFIVNTTEGNNKTPEWSITGDSNTYNASNDTWTGNTTGVEFTVSKVSRITGITVTYETEGDTPVNPDPDPEPGEYKDAKLRFTEALDKGSEAAQNVTISNNDVTAVFTSTSASAEVRQIKGYFGTADDYQTLDFRYGGGTKSNKGIESATKGTLTLPCDGTLTIYAYNTQTGDRNIQIVQNNETLLDVALNPDDAVTPEGTERKIYPVHTVDVKKGTAYVLYPTNQVFIFGFDFTPDNNTSGVEDIVVEDVQNLPAYDLYGRPVSDDYKGFVICGGKKYLRR